MTLKQFLYKEKYGDEGHVGKLITFKDGKQLLIGDMNTMGGVCDDCKSYDMNKEIECVEQIWKHK